MEGLKYRHCPKLRLMQLCGMRNIWSPESFQGKNKKRNYFEGWYFKHSAGLAGGVWSFIPGIALGPDGEGYSFVQVIEGRAGRSWWFQYPQDAFSALEKGLEVRVGDNTFSSRGLNVKLGDASTSIEAELQYGPFSKHSFPFWSPGVMGPFTFMPGMECIHGLVSMDHTVEGFVRIDGLTTALTQGRGYIEKDWGKSMPEAWIWTQSNDFLVRGDSLMLSVAKIPFMGTAFRGFLCTAALGGRKYLFTTYNGSRIQKIALSDSEIFFHITRKVNYGSTVDLEILATRTRGGILRAPVSGLLSRRISEAVDASLRVRLKVPQERDYEAEAKLAGLEIVGDLNTLGIIESI